MRFLIGVAITVLIVHYRNTWWVTAIGVAAALLYVVGAICVEMGRLTDEDRLAQRDRRIR